MKKKVLYVTSENAATSIPLELAGAINETDCVDIKIVTYYGVTKGNYYSQFADNIIDLNLTGIQILKGFSTINKIIKIFKPDVVHVHHNFSALITIMAAKLNKVKKIIKTEHNYHKKYKWHQKFLNIPILFFSDVIICNSKSTVLSFYYWEKIIAKNKLHYIYNGINTDAIAEHNTKENYINTRKLYNIDSKEKLFVCASRLNKQKNLYNLIKAFSYATATNNNIRLIIAGDGELKNELYDLKNKLDRDDKISFTGMLSRRDVFRLLNAADFFIIVSYWEGFCNAAVEAMAARCPLICSDIVTLKEVAAETAAFVNPSSTKDIESTILKYANLSTANYSDLSKKAYEKAILFYSLKYTVKNYIDYYL